MSQTREKRSNLLFVIFFCVCKCVGKILSIVLQVSLTKLNSSLREVSRVWCTYAFLAKPVTEMPDWGDGSLENFLYHACNYATTTCVYIMCTYLHSVHAW